MFITIQPVLHSRLEAGGGAHLAAAVMVIALHQMHSHLDLIPETVKSNSVPVTTLSCLVLAGRHASGVRRKEADMRTVYCARSW